MTAQAVAGLHLAPRDERHLTCVLLLPPYRLGRAPDRLIYLPASCRDSEAKPRPGPRFPDSFPSAQCSNCWRSCGVFNWLVCDVQHVRAHYCGGACGCPSPEPAPVVVQRPQLTSNLEAAQLCRCPRSPRALKMRRPPPQPDLLPFP